MGSKLSKPTKQVPRLIGNSLVGFLTLLPSDARFELTLLTSKISYLAIAEENFDQK